MIKMVLDAGYEELSQRRDQIHSALVHDVSTLTQASLSVIELITSSVVVIACLVYMGAISFPLFLATLGTSALGIGIYIISARKGNKRFIKTRDLEDGFMKKFNAMLEGAKEIHMDPAKGQGIYNRGIVPISKDAFGNNTKAFVGFLDNQITGQILFYSLIGAILLIFSATLDIEALTTVNFLFILLYLLGAIETMMVMLPGLMQARISLHRITDLEASLASTMVNKHRPVSSSDVVQVFENIDAKDLQYHYKTKEGVSGFGVGPISTRIEVGDVVFVYGGNGSGKTTFIHVLLGLLPPSEGAISFNGEEITEDTYYRYKELFSVVFNDVYLFDEFYGNEDFDREAAQEYLRLFEVDDKVALTETGFSTVDLSTGQRKRLALISALLEARPVIVLDEWAADQDPYFRKKFYTEILPELKQRGFTIIAITHDDAYYDCSNRLFKMEYGKLTEEKSEAKATLLHT